MALWTKTKLWILSQIPLGPAIEWTTANEPTTEVVPGGRRQLISPLTKMRPPDEAKDADEILRDTGRHTSAPSATDVRALPI